MKVSAFGSDAGVTASSPSVPVAGADRLRDHVAAVQVLVDVLDRVRDPHLRDHVVGRVGVGQSGALAGLEPAGDPHRAGRRRRRVPRPSATSRVRRAWPVPRGRACAVRADLDRGHGPHAPPPVQLPVGDVDRRLGQPPAPQLRRAAPRRPRGTGRPGTSPRRAAAQVRRQATPPGPRGVHPTRRTARPPAAPRPSSRGPRARAAPTDAGPGEVGRTRPRAYVRAARRVAAVRRMGRFGPIRTPRRKIERADPGGPVGLHG